MAGTMSHPEFPNTEVITAVREYASEHYNEAGWDFVVESLTDAEIANHIGWASTLKGAVRKLQPLLSTLNERRQEQEAEVREGEERREDTTTEAPKSTRRGRKEAVAA